MQQTSTFKVYNASAGSGKTFTLVKEYLKVLLKTENVFAFQQILAITFTNKAAAEMKERVLGRLQDFSEKKDSELLNMLSDELAIDKNIIAIRSDKILQAILQNYSAFYITTIDSFTYKIIKSFAFDLGLTQNFEIEMNPNELLNQAVEVLISKIGIDEKLTKLLIEYSLDKADDDKSWDISRDLNEFSKIILSENDAIHFEKLSDKELDDFSELKKKVSANQKTIVKRLKEIGSEGLTVIETIGLLHTDFYRGTIPKFFSDLHVLNQKFNFLKRSETIEKAIENNQFYTKSLNEDSKAGIENIKPELIRLFIESQNLYKKYLLNKLTHKSIVPLAVLNQIYAALQTIKEENNIQLNAEFNQLISKNIKEQPAPYIYERMGQKFHHYFIDEMQDTSQLQWQNLIPLIENALSQEGTGLLLVGDGKQAIYRWRGGKAEQFIELGSEEQKKTNPFFLTKRINKLEYNYRSYSEIIDFNNSFFKHCASYMQNALYKDLYLEKSHQKENKNKGGYVQISFIEKIENKEENDIKYAKQVFENISTLSKEFVLSDICILVRRRKEGVIIANYLSERGIEIISSENLLVQNSKNVTFIIQFLNYLSNPKNEDALFELLYFLSNHLTKTKDKHPFFKTLIYIEQQELFQKLESLFGVYFNIDLFNQLPLYEKVEYIIRCFDLLTTSDAYLQFFLDEVLGQQKKDATVQDLIDFWVREKDALSIVAPQNPNAVQIMTIHKSKGLEFPIVIFPCDLDIYRQINPKVWLNELPKDVFNGFEELLVSFNKEVSVISKKGEEVYLKEREKLELDNLNLLYVALTRAKEQLYILTEEVLEKNLGKNTKYSDFFTNYLTSLNIYDTKKREYSFGSIKRVSEKKESHNKLTYQEKYINTPWQDHHLHMLSSSSLLWDTKKEEAITYGNLIHEMMAKIYDKSNIQEIVKLYVVQGIIYKKEAERILSLIQELVNNTQVAMYYLEGLEVYNEREIVTRDHHIIIPDRLVIYPNKEVVIIDYKTGKHSENYRQQLQKYAFAMSSIGYKVVKKILIYINDKISVEEI
ncbi:MAG: UvrD-helicase domain-containing protein [Flavobacteriaceae bacterium]